ncbi:PTS sugar transporter subunit IIB [Gracilibacillus alcaliphilus]|uniref:PTS sugar transporter subunit IIB n=1 Tax=Gracilibacillus alcaliphilus TaxID=1401441 RepID=UPI001956F3A4|nr:PTS sugar transporter subunit IIB [Gracilibacillus alcaliphilus]MBM7676052.1 PTS system cellobiose-specific IIB component [Gracilibacillus alcaliphilus]
MKKTILLICSGGASSGFLAQNIRKAAKKRGLEVEVLARGESELTDYLDKISMVLIAPHLSYIQEDIAEQLSGTDIPYQLIDQMTYGTLNGDKGLDIIVKELGLK